MKHDAAQQGLELRTSHLPDDDVLRDYGLLVAAELFGQPLISTAK